MIKLHEMGEHMNIQLMTDGGADIPERLARKADIIQVPLYLHFSDKQYRAGVDMDLPSFYKKIEETKELPRSSAPSPHDFYEAYKQVDKQAPILMLSLTKGLSSTYENAVTGMNMLLEEEPERTIAVINTKTASCGIALLLHEAITKIEENYTFIELVEHIQKRADQTATLFVLKTLENLIQGGRLDRVKGKIAKTLNIKLLMRASEDGEIEVTEKVRGDKRSIRRFIEQIGEYTKSFEDKVISLSHCNAEERAKNVLSEIRSKYPFKDAYIMDTGPLISTYGGKGALVISFFKHNK